MFHLTSDRGGNVANSGRSTTAAVLALMEWRQCSSSSCPTYYLLLTTYYLLLATYCLP